MLSRRIRALVLAVAALGFLGVPTDRVAARNALSVTVSCGCRGVNYLECTGFVWGGSGAYSYDWTPSPSQDQGEEAAIFYCGRFTDYLYVTLTVTDLQTSATASHLAIADCEN